MLRLLDAFLAQEDLHVFCVAYLCVCEVFEDNLDCNRFNKTF